MWLSLQLNYPNGRVQQFLSLALMSSARYLKKNYVAVLHQLLVVFRLPVFRNYFWHHEQTRHFLLLYVCF